MNLRNMDNKNTYMFDCFLFYFRHKSKTQNSMTEIIPFKKQSMENYHRSQYKWRNSKFCT